MNAAERLLGTSLDVIKVLDYGEGATHDVVLVARRDDPETRYVVKRSRGEQGPLVAERAALTAYAEHDAARALVPGVVAASQDGSLLEACERAIVALRHRWPEEHRCARMYRAFAGPSG